MYLHIFFFVLLVDAFSCSFHVEDGPSGKILKVYNYTGPFPAKEMQGAEEIDIVSSTIVCVVEKNVTFTKLRKFTSKHTKFIEVPTDSWVKFPYVSEANLEDTETDGMHLSKYNIYTSMEIFNVKNVQLGNLTNNALNQLKKLRHLTLTNAGITNVENHVFNGLDNLEYLGLDNNNFPTIPKEIFAPLKSLKILSLKKNNIVEFGLENLPQLPELEEIYLEENPVKNVDVEQLKKVAPKLKHVKIGA